MVFCAPAAARMASGSGFRRKIADGWRAAASPSTWRRRVPRRPGTAGHLSFGARRDMISAISSWRSKPAPNQQPIPAFIPRGTKSRTRRSRLRSQISNSPGSPIIARMDRQPPRRSQYLQVVRCRWRVVPGSHRVAGNRRGVGQRPADGRLLGLTKPARASSTRAACYPQHDRLKATLQPHASPTGRSEPTAAGRCRPDGDATPPTRATGSN